MSGRLRPGLLALLVLAGLLAACGKKPDTVEPPQGATEDTYPRTYPSS